jgi:hypothetical protein
VIAQRTSKQSAHNPLTSLAGAVGLPTKFSISYANIILLNIGELTTTKEQTASGKVWISTCGQLTIDITSKWQLLDKGVEVCSWNTERMTIRHIFSSLSGSHFNGVTVDSNTHVTDFSFQGDHILRTLAEPLIDDTLWFFVDRVNGTQGSYSHKGVFS